MRKRGLVTRICAGLTCVLVLGLLGGCAGGNGVPAKPGPAADISSEAFDVLDVPALSSEGAAALVGAAEAPAAVDQALWEQLKAELARVLAARGSCKVAAAPPLGLAHRVIDLRVVREDGGASSLAWSYVNVGDYDQNGEVNISDLTPLGMHFGSVGPFAYSSSLSAIDGDGNGEVNIADVTPIGMHLLTRTTSYGVYASEEFSDYPASPDAPNGPGTRLLCTVDFSEAEGSPSVDRRRFSCPAEELAATEYCWVRPLENAEVGTPSAVILRTGRGDWWMHGREPLKQGRSPHTASWTNDVLWTYAAGDAVRSSPALRADGVVYVGSDDNSLHAINPDGTLLWTFLTGAYVYSSPAIGVDRTVYFGSGDGGVYAVNPDGTMRWVLPIGSSVHSSPAIGDDGTIYVGSNANVLHALNPDGTERWSFPVGDVVQSCPAVGPDGTVYVGCFDNTVYAINPDGTERWTYTAGDLIGGSPAVGSDGVIYIGDDGGTLYAFNADGSERWTYEAGSSVTSRPAIGADGAVYLAADGRLHALSLDGTRQWDYELDGNSASGPAIGADGTIYVGGGEAMYAFNPDGTLHWRYDADSKVDSSPAIGVDGSVVVGTDDGTVLAFGGGTGTPALVADPLPREGIEGTEVTLRAVVSGTPPIAYSWDFGGGATPNTSSDPTATVTLGEPGIYSANVIVDNAYGAPGGSPFTLAVLPEGGQPGGWEHSWGGESGEMLASIIVDSEGNLCATGGIHGFDAQQEDVLLMKYDPGGTLLFAKAWGGEGNEWGACITVDGADNMYVVGRTSSFCTGDDEDDALLLRYDPAGELLWAKTWDGGEYDVGSAVAIDGLGNILVAGTTTSLGAGSEAALFVVYDSAGVYQSAHYWDTPEWDAIYSMAPDSAGNVYVAGITEAPGGGNTDFLLMRYLAAGDLDWVRTWGTGEQEFRCTVAVDSEDSAYLAGMLSWVVKYDVAGDLQWARGWAGTDFCVTGGVDVAGDLVVLSGNVRLPDDTWDGTVLAGDRAGNVDWGQRFVTTYDNDTTVGIAVDGEGQVCLVGIGRNNLGLWVPLEGLSAADIAGTDATPAHAGGDFAGTAADVTALDQFVTGTEDAGGGEEDATIFRRDFSD